MADEPLPPLSLALWPAPYADTGHNPLALNLPMMGLPIAVALIDNSGIVISGNDALKATVGSAYFPGTRPEWLFVAEDADKIARAIAETLSGNERTEVRAALHDRPDEKQIVSIVPVPPGFGAAGDARHSRTIAARSASRRGYPYAGRGAACRRDRP